MKVVRIVSAFLLVAVPELAGQQPQGPRKLESLHGSLMIMISEDEGLPGEIWAKGNNTRVEIKDGERKIISIQLGEMMYTYIESSGEEGTKQHLGRGLSSMGLIEQIAEIKSRGEKKGSEEIEGVRYDQYEYNVNAPEERATVYLSPETSLPRIWTSVIKTTPLTVSVLKTHYRDMEANPDIPDDMFKLPLDVTFSEEPETRKPHPPGETTLWADDTGLTGLKEIGSLAIEADGQDMFYHQGLVLLAAGVNGLIVIDATSPEVLGQVPIQSMAIAVAAEGAHAYVSAGPAGYPLAYLTVVDISDPRTPKVVAQLDVPDYPAGLAVRDKIVYLADRSEGLRIISVADPVSPEEIASVTDVGSVSDVVLSDHYALVLSPREGTVSAIDVSSPGKPAVVGKTTLKTQSEHLAVFGKKAFVSMGEAGVAVLDISDPSRLNRVDYLDTSGTAVAVLAAADRLLIADINGLCLARGENYSEIEKHQNEEDILTFRLAGGEGRVFVLYGLEPPSMYGLFGEIAVQVLGSE